MLKIEKYVTPSPEQWEVIIEGMRNPMNSWDRMDSYITHIESPETLNEANFEFVLGENDARRMGGLAAGGPVHAKYRRMIPVWVTLTAPLYWWKEFDTYKVGTVCNSCSTMHKIHEKEFTLEDFSTEHLIGNDIAKDLVNNEVFVPDEEKDGNIVNWTPLDILELTIKALNTYREVYLKTKDKKYWWQMIQLLPSSYNQKRTVMLNYEVLANIFEYRKSHKLDEWVEFCKWIETLPYSEIITGETSLPESEFLRKKINIPERSDNNE